MKIPIEWLKQYISTTKSDKEIAESFTQLGLLLDKPIQNGVLDLEHRMDRSDWLGVLGCARDLCAFENSELKYPPVHSQPGKTPSKEQLVKVTVECPDLVHRFNTRVFRNITVKTSPDWLKNRLEAYGIPSINNIVDITNYVMVELGQPMHAQDLAKFEKQEIVIRRAKNKEQMTTLLGETVSLTSNQFVLAQNGKAIVLGGIVGGDATRVDENTTDIILDSGNYNQNNVRASSRFLKIQNESVLRYDKFLHPQLTQLAIERAAFLILELAGGEYYENVDYYPKPWPARTMTMRESRLIQVGGVEIPPSKILTILNKLEYKVLEQNSGSYRVEVPYFRTDVLVEDDIVADILRISDYTNIPVTPIASAPPVEITPKDYLLEDKIRDILVNLGFHEHITDPLVTQQENIRDQVKLKNALTSEKSAMRRSVYETLLPVAEIYKKAGYKEISLFEAGKFYFTQRGYHEVKEVAALYQNTVQSSYAISTHLKRVLSGLMTNLGFDTYKLAKTHNGADIMVGATTIGKLTPAYFSIYPEVLVSLTPRFTRVQTEVKNTTRENLSLIVDTTVEFGLVLEEIKSLDKNILNVEVEEEFVSGELPSGKKAILLALEYATAETAAIRKAIISRLAKNYKIAHRES